MKLRAAIAALFLLAAPALAQDIAAQAAKASADLTAAIAALQAAGGARDRVAALTQTIRAYEAGLAALREAMRQAELREATLKLSFEAKRERIAQLVAVLARMEANPGPLLLLHPEGPLGTARSGMILADVAPALQAETETLKAELQELADLRALQRTADDTLSSGLQAAQAARTALSKAISDRTDLPKKFTEDPAVLNAILQSATTLDDFAALLSTEGGIDGGAVSQPFAGTMGALPLPVLGTLIRRPDEADAAGVRRPGMTLATRPRALVTAPWPATIRYIGPLLDYGNVIVLEPGDGYLLVLAGLGTLYGEVGEIVPAGAPLGLMGGTDAADPDLAVSSAGATGASDTETLYLELRLGASPVDPTEWFAATATTGE
jgi:septal ring factor EnvC (AmiA/AmiB activator)